MVLTNSEKESNTLNASVFTVVWLFIFIVQFSGKKLIIGNVTVKNYVKEHSSKKGLILKFISLRMVINFDMIGFLVFKHAMK